MEPTTPPPWRVLDAPVPTGGVAATSAPTSPRNDALLLRIVATVGGVLACVIIAVVIALGGAQPTVVVDGAIGLTASATAASGDAGALASGTAGGELVVEVVGAVPEPGVYRLPPGSRVGDLVAAAGGYGPRIDTVRASVGLNLAAPLRDGDQIRVPSRDDPVSASPMATSGGPAPSGAAEGALVDLNRATQSELEDLPGIGPVTAQKILAAREEAPFTAVEELRSRGIIGEKTFDGLRDLVTVT